MYPEIFGVIKSYGLMMALSFALGYWLSVVRGRKYGLSSEVILDLVFGVFVSSLIGVRLMFVLTHLGQFDGDPTPWYHAFFIWDGGLTLYGGIGLATLTVWIMTRRRNIPFMVMADIFSPGVILGIGITRIGCFLAGCCFGSPTGCACGITFPADAPASLQFGPVPVLPSQLFSSAGGFVVFGLLLLLERVSDYRGATFGRFLLLYGLSRFLVDFTRYYEPDQIMMMGLDNNQYISLGMIAAGLAVMIIYARRARGLEVPFA
jgi:phosphatidylglycerol:prolipoprotein diacylglycerol transferase